MSFGDALRQAREARGLSTQDVALRTKIRGDYLRALEDGNIALLPERTFARSYLQRYARELNLDPTPLLADFDRSVPPTHALGVMRGPRTASPARPRPALPLAALLSGVLVLSAGGYAAYRFFGPGTQASSTPAGNKQNTTAPATDPASAAAATPAVPDPVRTVNLSVSSVPSGARVYLDNRDLGLTPLRSFPVDARDDAQLRVEYTGRQPLKQSVSLTRGRNLRARLLPPGQGPSGLTDLAAPKPVARPASPAPASKPGAQAQGGAATTSPAAQTPPTPVSVQFTAAAWTRVTDASGRVLYEGTPPVGTRKAFPAGVTVRTGNAGAVRVSVKGAAPRALGEAGQVVSRQF